VHIDCPADVLGQAAQVGQVGRVGQVGQVGRVGQVGQVGRAEDIESIVASARAPLLLIGLGARDRDAATAVRELCASHHVNALVTYKAKGVVSDRDPHFAGVFTNGLAEADVIASADLLIGIGLDPIELLPRAWPYRQPIVNVTPYEVACDHVPFTTQFVGDIAAGVRRIAAVLRPGAERTPRATRIASTSASGAGLAPGRVVELVAAAFPDARVTVDAGAHMFPATLLWPVGEPAGMLISNGLSTMGFALPAAIGAAVADHGPADRRRRGYGGPPKRPAKAEAAHYGRRTVALTGDGGLLMCAGELLTAAREHLPIVVVVFNDAALTLIDIKQRQREQPIAGVSLGSVKWCALAQSMGVAGHAAATEDELRAALAAVRDADGPSLIEAMIDPRGYDAMFKALRG
jgi:acetolactate synthase-1/2/3 large subunit